MGIYEKWIEDIPQQFRNKKNIGIIIKAFSKELEQLYQVFQDINTKTDLETAQGINLDIIGNIVLLSRKEAGILTSMENDKEMLDERYRQLLKYKILKNTSECTYADIMTGLEYIYNYKFRYREDERYPATIILDIPSSSLGEVDKKFYKELCIRGSGIGILTSKSFYDFIKIQILFLVKKFQIKNEFYPRLNIPYLKYDGIAKYDRSVRYDKYKSNERIELYPIQLKMKSEIKSQIIFLPEIRMKNIFKAPIYTETKLIYKKDIPTQSKFETKLKIKKETVIMPKYKINLKIGKHLTKYNSAARYDGTKQYYVENEEII